MKDFLKKVLYYSTLVMPVYNFFKDICVNGYAIYINHQQEIETAKMKAHFFKDHLEEITYEDFLKSLNDIHKKGK